MSAEERVVPGAYRRFLLSWLDAPFAVGAVAPSGRRLARLLTRDIRAGDLVVELGPGTGTVTREILNRGVRQQDLHLVERCRGFADLLRLRFPNADVVCGDAAAGHPSLDACRGKVDSVISGLPLVLFSREQKSRLLDQVFGLLGADGAFYQFTYGGRCPVDRRQLAAHGLEARCIGFIARNMPPAFVYRIARRPVTG